MAKVPKLRFTSPILLIEVGVEDQAVGHYEIEGGGVADDVTLAVHPVHETDAVAGGEGLDGVATIDCQQRAVLSRAIKFRPGRDGFAVAADCYSKWSRSVQENVSRETGVGESSGVGGSGDEGIGAIDQGNDVRPRFAAWDKTAECDVDVERSPRWEGAREVDVGDETIVNGTTDDCDVGVGQNQRSIRADQAVCQHGVISGRCDHGGRWCAVGCDGKVAAIGRAGDADAERIGDTAGVGSGVDLLDVEDRVGTVVGARDGGAVVIPLEHQGAVRIHGDGECCSSTSDAAEVCRRSHYLRRCVGRDGDDGAGDDVCAGNYGLTGQKTIGNDAIVLAGVGGVHRDIGFPLLQNEIRGTGSLTIPLIMQAR